MTSPAATPKMARPVPVPNAAASRALKPMQASRGQQSIPPDGVSKLEPNRAMPKKKPSVPVPVTPKDTSMEGNPNRLEVVVEVGETMARALARTMLLPNVGSAITTNAFRTPGLEPAPLGGLIQELGIQCEQVRDGQMARGEGMLVAQAHTLDAIFNCLAQRAALNTGTHMGAVAEYLRLALKAQAQARVTWEAVAALKNPSRISARQLNIAHGHQQVNNGVAQPATPTHTETGEIRPNELLEVGHEQRVDARAQSAAVRSDKAVETLGPVNRP